MASIKESKLPQLFKESEYIVALTGAGISTASGIPDFRSDNGLWKNIDPMKELSLSAFRNNPANFWSFYHDRMEINDNISPNPAHQALYELEQSGKLKGIITQNIDGLHQKAGNQEVLEVHGSPQTVSCLECYKTYPWKEAKQLIDKEGVPRCECEYALKPDIILFEENLSNDVFAQVNKHLASCDLLLCVGSSLVVQPVANIPVMVAEAGIPVIIVNRDATPVDDYAEIVIRGSIENILPQLADLV